MKKRMLLLYLTMGLVSGLYAMEQLQAFPKGPIEGEAIAVTCKPMGTDQTIKTIIVPQEILCEIARHALEKSTFTNIMPIVDQYQPFNGEYDHRLFCSWAPNSLHVALVDAQENSVGILNLKEKFVTKYKSDNDAADNVLHGAAWAPNSQQFALGSIEGTADIITPQGQCKAQHTFDDGGPIRSIEWSSDGQHLALSGYHNVNFIKSAGDHSAVYTPNFNVDPIGPTAWVPRESSLVVVCSDVEKGEVVKIVAPGQDSTREFPIGNEKDPVCRVACSCDGRYLALGRPHKVQVFTTQGTPVRVYNVSTSARIKEISWSPDNKYLAILKGWSTEFGERMNYVIVEPLGDAQPKYEYTASSCYVSSLSWSPDGQHLAVSEPCNKEEAVKIITPKGEFETAYQVDNDDFIRLVSWSPDGRFLALASFSGKVTMVNMMPLLLATYAVEKPTLFQLFLLKRLQEQLIKNKKPLLIGQADRNMLDDEKMKNLKKLLKIEKSRSNTQNPIWRLQLKEGAELLSSMRGPTGSRSSSISSSSSSSSSISSSVSSSSARLGTP